LGPGTGLSGDSTSHPLVLQQLDIQIAFGRPSGALLKEIGFADIKTTYWNTVLLPLMVIHRLLSLKSPDSDVRLFARPVEMIFRKIMRFETFMLNRGLRFPYGGSIIASAIKE
jgi:hypothetical protein